LRQLRVGGTYWSSQPELPGDHVLVCSSEAVAIAQQMFPTHPIVVWQREPDGRRCEHEVMVVRGECDPWHMLSRAAAFVTDATDELQLIAGLLEVQGYELEFDKGAIRRVADPLEPLQALAETSFENPFTGELMNALLAAELCGFWRKLIDSNRDIAGGVGFAFWKQDYVAPLLWDGAGEFRFVRNVDKVEEQQKIALWRAKTPPTLLAELERKRSILIEVEDGFLRSRGLGADCIPPLSITVDRLGAHFDPAQPSELEMLLQDGEFDDALLERAQELRRLIVEAGIGKYDRGTVALARPAGKRRHILVPGQVEDDRAVKAGGCGLTSNLELLQRVRERASDAYIIYRPHPDVLAGHRRGAIADGTCLRYADTIIGELPISSLIDMIDEVHVNTSLAGFEALMRGKSVTTYGVPFYAGWGLTEDLGPVPARRTARRSLDELVAATLLLYPRYLDPVTGLPCPAEVVVQRLTSMEHSSTGVLVGMRRLQGKLMRRLRRLV
jgi:capsular polysaccharide export protein